MNMEYRVKWEIDIEADSQEEAVKEALKIQRDTNSIATVFEVTSINNDRKVIDLTYNVEYCVICERNEVDENSPILKGIGKVCHDCCNRWVKDNYEENL